MNRRTMLVSTLSCIAGIGVGGLGINSISSWSKSRQQSKLQEQLLSQSNAIWKPISPNSIKPALNSGSNEIKLWFTGHCLNSSEFVDYLSSNEFFSLLKIQSTEKAIHALVEREFYKRVVAKDQIHEFLKIVETESMSKVAIEVTKQWDSCCTNVSNTWSTTLNLNEQAFSAQDIYSILNNHFYSKQLSLEVNPEIETIISKGMSHSIHMSQVNHVHQQLSQAIILFCTRTVPIPYRVMLLALRPIANLFFSIYQKEVIRRTKAEISHCLAQLGNNSVDTFQSSVLESVSILHTLQNASLNEVAKMYAYRTVPA